MTRKTVQTLSAATKAVSIRHKVLDGLMGAPAGPLDPKEFCIHTREHPWIVVGRAPDHDSIHMLEVTVYLLHTHNPAVDLHKKLRHLRLEPIDILVAQGRNRPVFLWAQPV